MSQLKLKLVDETKTDAEEDAKTTEDTAAKSDEAATPATPETPGKDGRRGSKKSNKLSSPKKRGSADSNDPFRFQGAGVDYRAKIIGIQEVEESKGDEACRSAMEKAKQAVKAAGQHKQRIFVNVSLDGIKIKEQVSGEELHKFAVSEISFISRDPTDYRAFGFIHIDGETKYQFYGIKTEKPADNVVLAIRDMLSTVFEMRQKRQEGDGAAVEETAEQPPIENLVDIQTENQIDKKEEISNDTSNVEAPAKVTGQATEQHITDKVESTAVTETKSQPDTGATGQADRDPFEAINSSQESDKAAPVLAPTPPPPRTIASDLVDIFSAPLQTSVATLAAPNTSQASIALPINNTNPFADLMSQQTSTAAEAKTITSGAPSGDLLCLASEPSVAQPALNNALPSITQHTEHDSIPPTVSVNNPFGADIFQAPSGAGAPVPILPAASAAVPGAQSPEVVDTTAPMQPTDQIVQESHKLPDSVPPTAQDPYSKLVGSIDEAVKTKPDSEKKDPFYDLKHVQKPRLIDAMDNDRSSKAMAELSALMNNAQLSTMSAPFATSSSPVFGGAVIPAPTMPSPANPFQAGSYQTGGFPAAMGPPHINQPSTFPLGSSSSTAVPQQYAPIASSSVPQGVGMAPSPQITGASIPGSLMSQNLIYPTAATHPLYMTDPNTASALPTSHTANPSQQNPFGSTRSSMPPVGFTGQPRPVFEVTSSLGIFDPSESFLTPKDDIAQTQDQQKK